MATTLPPSVRELVARYSNLNEEEKKMFSELLEIEQTAALGGIPEIDELESQLRFVAPGDQARAKEIISDWVKGLEPIDRPEPIDRQGRPRRRYRAEVEADKALVREWVERLNVLFLPLENKGIHAGKVYQDYGVDDAVVSAWKLTEEKGFLKSIGKEKNRVLFNEKAIAIAAAINRKFTTPGSKLVSHAMEFYKSLNAIP